MRAVPKALGASLTAAALAAAGPVAASGRRRGSRGSGLGPSPRTARSGFGYGTDSWPVSVTGKARTTSPSSAAGYGGYMGMAGNWARTEGCKTGNFLAWSSANGAPGEHELHQVRHRHRHRRLLVHGRPRRRPALERHHRGGLQVGRAAGVVGARGDEEQRIPYPVVWADIELPGIAPAPDNGWNSVYSSPCSGASVQRSVPANVDRAEFNGFATYVTSHSKYKVGVYSSAPVWTSIFGTGQYGVADP